MSDIKNDPIEEDPRFAEIFENADRETMEELKDEPRKMGFCHIYWDTKQRILREKYGIDWKTPGEMNPGICFD